MGFLVGGNIFFTAVGTHWFNGEWTLFIDQYREILHSEIICSNTDIETMQNAGFSKEEIKEALNK